MNSQINDRKKKPKEKKKKCCLVLIFNFVYELCGVEGLVIGGNVLHRSFCVKGVREKVEPKVEEEKEEACFLMCFNFRYSPFLFSVPPLIITVS